MGSPRHARSSDRLRARLERAHGDRGPEVHSLAGRGLQQVLRLASPLRQGERTQRLDPSRLLVGGVGEAGHRRVPRPLPAGRLSAADLHDVGCRRRGGESRQRLASLAPGRSTGTLEKQDVEQGQGLSPTAGPAPTLARGYLLSQSGGNVLLPVQRADGYSRYLLHWEIRESMTEAEVEIILQRAREQFPQAAPRVISDNGPQFIARDFKEFIRLCGMTHVRTSPFYPQSNGKIERWHQSLKGECVRPGVPLTV